jgi:hypothetical protein
MANPTITIHDLAEDEVITREMTSEEVSQQKIIFQQIKTEQEKNAKADLDKAELLTKLGITADEARLLLN